MAGAANPQSIELPYEKPSRAPDAMTIAAPEMVSIVVPVLNEEKSLRILHEELTAVMRERAGQPYEIIFVDDGSTDGSFICCRELFEEDSDHVRVIRLRRNFGQTAAMAAGFHAAKGDIIVPIDADLQNDPADIHRLIDKLHEGYDVVSGWRRMRKDPFIFRQLPSICANYLISRITYVHLHDYGCTLKAYRREIMSYVSMYGEMHRFLPSLANWAGAKVTEIPVNHRPRKFGASKYGITRTRKVILDLITIKFLLTYSTKPMQIFGKWGLYSWLAGLGVGVFSIIYKFINPAYDMTDSPWMYLAFFFLMGGLQLITMGLLGEIVIRTYYESQGKAIYTVQQVLGENTLTRRK